MSCALRALSCPTDAGLFVPCSAKFKTSLSWNNFFCLCSFLLFVQKKRTKEKGVGNEKLSQGGRLLHWPYWRYRPGLISRHFRFAIALQNIEIHKILFVFWISNGPLRRLAVVSCIKPFILKYLFSIQNKIHNFTAL